MKSGSIVKIADNSGPTFVRIIKILKKSPHSQAKVGDFVVGSVLRLHDRIKFKVKKGSIVRGLVIRCADPYKRKDGQHFRFQFPAVVIVTKSGLPRSTKIFGPVPKEIREMGLIRVISLSTLAL